MLTTFPGTSVEVSSLKKGSSRTLFEGIFATAGVTLSQVCIMTGLEPYMIQNWVKRGFISSPVKRVYSKEQLAKILIINMLRDVLPLEQICDLVSVIAEVIANTDEDLSSADELYHRYVDILSDERVVIGDKNGFLSAAEDITSDIDELVPNAKNRLFKLLLVLFNSHSASIYLSEARQTMADLSDR